MLFAFGMSWKGSEGSPARHSIWQFPKNVMLQGKDCHAPSQKSSSACVSSDCELLLEHYPHKASFPFFYNAGRSYNSILIF